MTLLGNKQLTHPKECLLREVHCPVQICPETISLSKCMDHMYSRRHKAVYQLENQCNISFGSRSFEVSAVSYLLNWSIRPLQLTWGPGQHFFVEFIHETRSMEWIAWIYYLGSAKDSEKFSSEIKIRGNKNKAGKQSAKLFLDLLHLHINPLNTPIMKDFLLGF
jgi:hypothetical protein